MEAKELMTHDLPVLSLNDTGERAKYLMEEYRVFHLPIISRDNYIALVSEDDILDWDTPQEPLSLADFLTFRPAINGNSHIYGAMKLIKKLNLSVLPVIDNQGHYLGVINSNNLINSIASSNVIEEPGSIIILEIGQGNYSLSEIARICESNNVTILGSSVSTIPDGDTLQVTIKTNKTDIKATIATFERYNYTVAGVYESEEYTEDLADNYGLLMRYIDL